jgi:hypothetical protein
MNKPPLGLMPHWRWVELRIVEISEAIARYEAVGKRVPCRWRIELIIHKINIAMRRVK